MHLGTRNFWEKLIYLSHTRPDIDLAVSLISQFMHSPKVLEE